MNQLSGSAKGAASIPGNMKVDIPLAKSLQRIVRRKNAFTPELEVAPMVVDESRTRVPAHEREIDRVRTAPTLLDGNHFTATRLRIKRIGHDGSPSGRGVQERLTARLRTRLAGKRGGCGKKRAARKGW